MAVIDVPSATVQSAPDQLPNVEGLRQVPFDHPPTIFQNPAYARVLQQIHRLGTLPEGWDSYGANPVGEDARANAARFLTMLAAHSDDPVPLPVVGPSVEGGVVIRWELGDIEVMVKLLGRGGEYYVAKRGQDELQAEGEVGRLEALVNRLERFLAG